MTVFETSTFLSRYLPLYVSLPNSLLVSQLISVVVPSEGYCYQHTRVDNVQTSAEEYVETFWRGTLNSSTDNVHGVGPLDFFPWPRCSWLLYKRPILFIRKVLIHRS